MLKIGEFARQGGVSVKALRHYHRLGLLVPVYVDRFTGYRYYRDEQLCDLRLLLYLRSLGLSLAQVGEIMAAADTDELQTLLFLRKEELQRELTALTYQLKKVQSALESLQSDDFHPEHLLRHEAPISFLPAARVKSEETVNVKIETRQAQTFIGLKRTFNMAAQEQENKIPAMWDEFHEKYYAQIKPFIADPGDAYGLCSPLLSTEDFDYMIAWELVGDTPAEPPDGIVVEEIPSTTYAVFEAPGPAENIGKAYEYAHNTWLPESEQYEYDNTKADFEMYPADEFKGFEPGSMLYIYIPVKKK